MQKKERNASIHKDLVTFTFSRISFQSKKCCEQKEIRGTSLAFQGWQD